MDYLNLEIHDPDEYSGKIIQANGAIYLIGEYIGSGAHKIVHYLVNKASGFSQHVLKIVRDPTHAKEQFYRNGDPKKLAWLYKEAAIYAIPIQIPGGEIEIQLGGSGDKYPDPTDASQKKAASVYNKGLWDEAASIYSSILSDYPNNPITLVNYGSVLAIKGIFPEALHNMNRACKIEPHIQSYHLKRISTCLKIGLISNAIYYYKIMRNIFPYECEIDHDLIIACLEYGNPEQADTILKEAYLLDEKEANLLSNRIITDRNNKTEALRKIFGPAKDSSNLTIPEAGIMEEAYSTYAKDPLISINYAFVLIDKGNYVLARDILKRHLHSFDITVQSTCLIKLAICETNLNNYSTALELIEVLMGLLQSSCENNEIAFADLPGNVRFITKIEGRYAQIEDHSKYPLEIISMAIDKASKTVHINDSIHKFIRLYQKYFAEIHKQ